MILIVSSTAAVTLKIDPSVVLATRQYVDKKTDDKAIEVKAYADDLLAAHAKSRNHPDASLTAKGFAQYSNAIDSDSEKQAATSKAVKTVAEAGVMAMSDHVQTDNPHDQYLQIANLLSEIKELGPTALAEVFKNLELGDAAKKGVATNAEVAAGITINSLITPSALMSLFSKRVFTTNDYIRIPDVPGGLIIQIGLIPSLLPYIAGTQAFTWALPIPFPNRLLNASLTTAATATPNSSFVNLSLNPANSGPVTHLTGFVQNLRTDQAVSVFYIAIGY
ncbi:phage tail protein [Yersinia bercovieri]|nr:bacteriophage tail fiber protein [Yersinia bercovieri]